MSNVTNPRPKDDKIFIMPQKFLELKKLVDEKGTETQKQLTVLAGDYIAGLNNMFYDREVTQQILENFDFPMFVKELEHEGLLKGKSRPEAIMLIMNVMHIVRHTWQLTGENGITKNGDDLRKAWPVMWEDDVTLPLDKLFIDVGVM